MATKTTRDYTVTIYVIGGNEPIEVGGAQAATVIADFEAGNALSFSTDEDGTIYDVYIPYEAIVYLTYTYEESSTEIRDDFCKEGRGR